MTFRFAPALAVAALSAGPMAALASDDANTAQDQPETVAEAVGNTVYAIGESTTDAAQAGIDAVGGVVDDAYAAASNVSAEMDAALTGDARIHSRDGELLGTYMRRNDAGNLAVIDLDAEMEGADERPIEMAGIPVQHLMMGPKGVTVEMTKAEFEAALRNNSRMNAES